MTALGLIDGLGWSALVLAFVGLGTQGFIGSSNVLIQTLTPDGMRGRAISVYSMIALGLVPGGVLLIGALARLTDLRLVFVCCGLLCAVVGVWTFAVHPKLRAS